MKISKLALAIPLGLFFAQASLADTQPAADAPDAPPSTELSTVTVSAALDRSRDTLSPEIGASQYVFERQTIDQLPLGDSTPLNQILLQAPGVVQDSYGQLHVRGDHGDLQYRINGIIIPESISGFGQTLDARVVERMQLLTGALPAQYGYRTAGVVEITSKPAPDTERRQHRRHRRIVRHVQSGIFAVRQRRTLELFPDRQFSRERCRHRESDAARNAIHDHTDQTKGFGYVSYLLNDDARLSFLFGTTNNRFQIPNNPDQAAGVCVERRRRFRFVEARRAPARSHRFRRARAAGQIRRHRTIRCRSASATRA